MRFQRALGRGEGGGGEEHLPALASLSFLHQINTSCEPNHRVTEEAFHTMQLGNTKKTSSDISATWDGRDSRAASEVEEPTPV